MANGEIRKNNEAQMTNFGLCHSGLIRHSSFVIRHFVGFWRF